MELAEAVRAYRDLRRPTYEAFVARMLDLLSALLAQSSISVAQLEGRAKEIQSFADKLSRKGYDDPFDQMKDVAGLRIVTYYNDDVYRVVDLLRAEFEVDYQHSTDKMEQLEPDEFGYRSFHIVAQLGKRRADLIEWRSFSDMNFEVQVRSVLQHAWSAISHKLDYKSTAEAPREIRRQLFRLSALLELADEEFTAIRKKSKELAGVYEQDVDRGHLAIPLNLDSLRTYIHERGELEKWRSIGENAGMRKDNDKHQRDFEAGLRRVHALLIALGVNRLEKLSSCWLQLRIVHLNFLKL